MTTPQSIIILILLVTVAMFLWGRWRHDMIALAALLACVVCGVIDPAIAFNGFGHPAVITVACVLVLSAGLQRSGAVDVLARHAMPKKSGLMLSLAALVGIGALLSGFMNNVGALALLMPVALQVANRLEVPPGRVLMPLAFGTILGGMTTLIGTPPNLIVSGFRAQQGNSAGFAMFDFTPVGIAVALTGCIFVVLAWRLVPARKQAGTEGFETGAYLTEARVTEKSKIADMRLYDIEKEFDDSGTQIVGLIRNNVKINAPSGGRMIRSGDILVLEAEVDSLGTILSTLGLELEESKTVEKPAKPESENVKTETRTNNSNSTAELKAADSNVVAAKTEEKPAESKPAESKSQHAEDIVLMELVVRPESNLQGRSATNIMLRSRYSLNLLAVSRDGGRSKSRLRNFRMQAGDLLLLQGTSESVLEFASDYGCVPLAKRELKIPDKKQAALAGIIMFFAVAGAAFGLLPAAISFALGVLASMIFKTVPPRSVYSSIDWPVIVLLAALIPVAGAMEATGTAELIASVLMEYVAQGNAIVALGMVLVITMFLSDLMNNAATAAVMCPIAIGAAMTLGVNADSFLMAVAIGASCAFLTPIGHQNNTLILGPGGFKFSDYWRLGLPLEILVVVVALPLLTVFWPL
ncbi:MULTISPECIES: SLC13 family permease [unclassified Arsukibacterium]|uniref:SLC13 family permease n=1 Tax=unclassified Arsukibacterium TaxID=2635278 RepID=UPI000C5BBA76|nr:MULTISPECIES: SLC13 family permease [unclassified Arsukibacterium]MAA95749.1 SLC13 family permease [Rheinheimera sp.]MBM33597.1 SLC13 family permease [Rheinheimera sp.]|tara:strand:+ start:190487 stop:192403 length:1917 start_codon:yes stop_codon:yes gene_type:complete